MHADCEGESDGAGDELRHAEQDATKVQRAGDDVVGQRLEIGAEDPERRITQQQGEAEGRENLGDHRPAHDVANEAEIDDEAEEKEQERRARAERERPAVQIGHHDEGDIHTDHDELAMGEIDDVHHPPDQRQPGREQRIDGADQEADDDDLQEDHAMTIPSPACGRGLG